jgi:3-hydroxybutyryl-CoA dehydratase
MSLDESLRVGREIPSINKKVTQKKINKYAEASGDYNPIHVDPEFGKKTFLRGTIAHGFISLSYLSEMLRNFFGKNWVQGGELDIAFIAPTRPGDLITARGMIQEIKEMESGAEVRLEVWCENQNGQKTVVGSAKGFKDFE